MTKKYYLHRISHEDYVSYSLMNQGYLTLGWNELAGSGILEAAKEKNYNKFDSIAKKYGAGNSRSRWSMWYFARMNIGDIIVVPLYNSKFSVFEICDIAKSIYVLEKDLPLPKVAWTKNKIKSIEINGKIINYYSFATKYCSYHNAVDFPIYDSYVDKVLRYFRDEDNFAKFNNTELKNYICFKKILIIFQNYYNLEKYNLKQIDKYIWQLGKDYFPKKY